MQGVEQLAGEIGVLRVLALVPAGPAAARHESNTACPRGPLAMYPQTAYYIS